MREEFFIERHGKRYVLYQGLLDEAHARGLKSIDTELLQVPTPENGNVAVVKATVEMEAPDAERSRTFSGIGDASPENVGRGIVPHIIRMAETRAKARALRDAVNVGATALEELTDSDDSDAPPVSHQASRAQANSAPPSARQEQARQQRASSGRDAGGASLGPRPVEEDPGPGEAAPAEEEAGEAPNGKAGEASPGSEGQDQGQDQARRASRGSSQKARKSQVDLLRTLAEELRGENGVARLEGRIGKSLAELTRAEADEWIDRLTPAEGRE